MIDPAEVTLGPGDQRDIMVEITAPDGFVGMHAFNITAFVGTSAAGGVTLHVHS